MPHFRHLPARSAGRSAVLLALAALAALLSGAARAEAPARSVGLEVAGESEEGVLLRYRLPPVTALPLEGGGIALRVPGCRLPAGPDLPALPYRPIAIALPPGARAEVEITAAAVDTTDRFPVGPLPERSGRGLRPGVWREDLPEGPFPATWTIVHRKTRLRDREAIRIDLYPVRFDRGKGTSLLLREATIRVRFHRGAPPPAGAAPRRADPFDPVYERVFVNGRSARAWKAPGGAAAKEGGDSFASASTWIRIEVGARGCYAIDYDDFLDLGIVDPRSTVGDPRTFRLYTGSGRPLPEDLARDRPAWMRSVAIAVPGEEDGSFDPGDRIEFYAVGVEGWIGEFEPDADTYFEHVAHRYATENVYWLAWGGSFEEEPLRMGETPAGEGMVGPGAYEPATFADWVHVERESIADLTRYGEDGLFWHRFSPDANRASYTIELPGAEPSVRGEIRVRFYHYADHENECGTERVELDVNGNGAGLQEWDSCELSCDSVAPDVGAGGETTWVCADRHIQPYDYVASGPWFADGENTVGIEVAWRQKVYLASIEIGYERHLRAEGGELFFRLYHLGESRVPIALPAGETPRVFDVSDRLAVSELSGFGLSGDSVVLHLSLDRARTFYLVTDSMWKSPDLIERVDPPDLRDVAHGASYLVIAADDLASPLVSLVLLRSAAMTTRLVFLSEVYDAFSWGVTDPVAIRDFLAHAVHDWPEGERPAYVLLVGDATADFRDALGWENRSTLPPLYRIDPEGDEVDTYPTDDFFAYLDPDSGGGDWAPDIAVGRFPASSPNEVASLAGKIVAYESAADSGAWRNRFLFLADDERKRGTPTGYDCAFLLRFTEDAETQGTFVPGGFEKEKIYLVEYAENDAHEKPEAREDYLARVNEGFLLSSYTGHGSYDKVAGEKLLTRADVGPAHFSNEGRLHLFTAWACSVGSFDLSAGDGLAEMLVKLEGGGAVASVAGSAPTYAAPSLALAGDFLPALLGGAGADPMPVGLALAAAKALSGASGGGRKTNDEKYALLGDPAMALALPSRRILFARPDPPEMPRGATITLSGSVLDEDGSAAGWFDGTCAVTVRGAADTSGYTFADTACTGSSAAPDTHRARYALAGPVLYRGEADVSGGRFLVSFVVPVGASLGPLARASAYAAASGGSPDAAGVLDSLAIVAAPADTGAGDTTGPSLLVAVEGASITDGVAVTAEALFVVTLEDTSGIDIRPDDPETSIAVLLDGGGAIDLSGLFAYDPNSHQRGTLSFRLADLAIGDLEEGEHEILFRAADSRGNRTEVLWRFVLVAGTSPLAFAREVLCHPNPFDPEREETRLVLDLTAGARVIVEVVTLAGKRIRVLSPCDPPEGCVWDGRDADGDPVANGVYLLRVIAEGAGGERVESIGKAVVLRR